MSIFDTLIILVISTILINLTNSAEVIWAVNCGGNVHEDKYGIRYQKDMLQEGIASDYGKNMMISRIPEHDQILYQTERYHTETFGYNIPIRKDGDYVLVLKFSEVWFSSSNSKVFDVTFNDQLTVITDLDIFARVGRSVAHDEYVPFSVQNNTIHFGWETVSLTDDNHLNVQFVKKTFDNPKINAIYVLRGKLEDVPKLPKIQKPSEYNREARDDAEDDLEVDETQNSETPSDDDDDIDSFNKYNAPDQSSNQPKHSSSNRKPRQSRTVEDPYASEESSINLWIPIAIGILAVVPLVFCVCKL